MPEFHIDSRGGRVVLDLSPRLANGLGQLLQVAADAYLEDGTAVRGFGRALELASHG